MAEWPPLPVGSDCTYIAIVAIVMTMLTLDFVSTIRYLPTQC